MTQRRGGGQDGLVVAGYMAVVPTAAPPAPGSGLPERILTVSHCLMDAPSPECWVWCDDPAEADALRVGTPAARTVTIGLRWQEAERLVREVGARMPYVDLLRRAEALPRGTAVLGYEVVGVEEPLFFHSWHCHDYAGWARDQLEVTVNDLGLVHEHEDAVRVRDGMLALPPRDQPLSVPWVVVALAEHSGDPGPG